jgi:(2Fe-2S) ferredoxin
MKTLGAEETGIVMDMPPSLKPGDIVLGSEALGLLPQEVIEANANKIAIAVPDSETGEVGLIWYESLTQEDIDRILEEIRRRQEVVEAQGERLFDHLARMQEMGLERGESWFDYEKKRKEVDRKYCRGFSPRARAPYRTKKRVTASLPQREEMVLRIRGPMIKDRTTEGTTLVLSLRF